MKPTSDEQYKKARIVEDGESLNDVNRCDCCLRELRHIKTFPRVNHGRRIKIVVEFCDYCGIKYQTRLKEHHGYEWRSHGRKAI